MAVPSRLHEYYRHILRQDILTLFSRNVKIKSMDVSMIFESSALVQNDMKYKAACFLEILTGKRPSVVPCNLVDEDATFLQRRDKRLKKEKEKQTSAEDAPEQASVGRTRRTASSKSIHGAAVANALQAGKTSLSADDYRKAAGGGSGTLITSSFTDGGLSSGLFQFLDKLREFVLPDIVAMEEHLGIVRSLISENDAARDLIFNEHDNSLSMLRKSIASKFQTHHQVVPHFPRIFPTRGNLYADSNPLEALTTYYFKSSDFLKFPDVERFFEPLSSIIAPANEALVPQYPLHRFILVRPTLTVEPIFSSPLRPEDWRGVRGEDETLDHLKAMNYLLGCLFNPFSNRIQVPLRRSRRPKL